jgi:antitoxin VapB
VTSEEVKGALENELQRLFQGLTLWDRLHPLRERIPARPSTGLAAAEASYDELSGDPGLISVRLVSRASRH